MELLDKLAHQIFMAAIAYKMPREYADALRTETRQVLQTAFNAGRDDDGRNKPLGFDDAEHGMSP